MPRAVVATVSMAGALASSASELDGAWVFDNAPSYPGVTMLEMTTRGGRTTGNVTTAWYGPLSRSF